MSSINCKDDLICPVVERDMCPCRDAKPARQLSHLMTLQQLSKFKHVFRVRTDPVAVGGTVDHWDEGHHVFRKQPQRAVPRCHSSGSGTQHLSC